MSDPVVEIPFSGGIDQSTREELVDAAGSFVLLENVRQNKRGAASKRKAYESLGSARLDATTRTVGRRILANDDQLCTIDDTNIDVHVPALSCFVQRARVPEAAFTYFDVPTAGLEYSQYLNSWVIDVAYVNGFIVVAEMVPAGVDRTCYVSLLDATTYAVVRGPEVILTASNNIECGLATFGTRCVLGNGNGAINRIQLFSIDTATAATITAGWSSLVSITATGTSGSLAMASLPTQTDRIAIAYDVGSGTDRLIVKTVGASGVIETLTIGTSSTTPDIGTIGLSEHGSTLWVCWAIAGLALVKGLSPGAITGTPLAEVNPAGYLSGVETLYVATAGVGDCVLVGFAGGAPLSVIRITTSSGNAVAETLGNTYWNALPIARPFLRNDRVYQWLKSNKDDDIVLCDITDPPEGNTNPAYLRPVVVPIVRGLRSYYLFWRCRTASLGSDAYAFAFSSKKTGVSDGITAVKLDFASADRWSPASYHRSTYLGGGMVALFDGSHVFESGFVCAPPVLSYDTGTAGSMSFTAGGRRYVAVYASPDADGNMHISGVSDPTDATGNITSKKITVSCSPLSMTARGTQVGVQVFFYATADGGVPPYHLIKSIANDPQTQYLNIEDNVDEATLATGALLYGSGNLPGTVLDGQPDGPQDHRAPPGLRFLTPYNGMLVGATDDEVWHTSQPVYGEAPWWSPIFSQQIDGKLTALFSYEGTLYATTRTSVFAMTGDPPNDAGTSGGLSAPRKLGIDRGCINARSVVVTNTGVFFQSERGYELFRAGAIEPIGDFVLDILADYPHVTSAVFDAKAGLVRISLASGLQPNGLVEPYVLSEGGDPSGGRDIIFDIVLGVWISIDRKYGSSVDQASQDAAMVTVSGTTTYAWLASDGVVYAQSATSHLDPGSTWVTQRAETAWIHIAGLQGEQFIDRMLLLAKEVTTHDLTISIAYDYGDYSKTRTFTATQIDALPREWLDAEINQTTSQAVRVKIEDATPSDGVAPIGTGEGASWVALTFGGIPHRGVKRTSGAQRSG